MTYEHETVAERIERRFKEYGDLIKDAGLNIHEVCIAAGGEVEREGNSVWYYAYPDGSCLQGGVPGWSLYTWTKD